MKVKEMTLDQARDALKSKQGEMGKVFEEAKTDDGKYDFNSVKCLGSDVKGGVAVAEKVGQMNAEANELGEHIDTLSAAEKAASDHADREKGLTRLPFGGGPGDAGRPANVQQFKSLGELVTEAKSFKSWADAGRGNGVTIALGDHLPSDMMAKSMSAETIGTKAAMTTSAGFAPEALRIGRLVDAATRPIQLLDIIPMGKTSQDAVPYMEETTRTHAAAETAEGGTYAEDAFAFTERTVPVRKITSSVPVTDEQLDDVPMIESYINGRLNFSLRQRLDAQVLAGNGTGSNLEGILNATGLQTHAKGTDPVPDAFFKAMTKVRTVGRALPTHTIMHPEDWQDIRLLRTTDGVYIWGNPSESGPERLWGLPVVQNEVIAAGRGLVGAFEPAFISLFERKGIEVQVGYVGTQFLQGFRTLRADMRAALAIFRKAAFCEVTGLNV